ncbi:hypothetical protein AVO45_02455 [Ruegeria marisrubri]|uniref:Uncharacterized protein n=1 Tax=Ruegeria marisrubri TaxID=1685379 RepID=A0A124F5P1_9RHOB|nr:hypothetical protein [Ruegeria marisrubri]KUJ85859.1 hypothetical protein AVO45_02455 [Ruegeria marisrubri]
MSSQSPQNKVCRRRVFYIPGYDPFPPRRYRELYRREAAEQARISGYVVELRPGNGDGPYGWEVTSRQDGCLVHSDIRVLVWSDVVQASMSKSIPATYLQLVRTAWIYISSGTLWRLMRMRKGPVLAVLYPVGMLVLQLLFAVGAGWLALSVAPLAPWAGLVLAVLVAVLILMGFRSLNHRFLVYYLMQDYAFSARFWGRYPPELEAKISEFSDLVGAAMQDDVDEVLVVGHSCGAHMGVSVLADVIRRGNLSGKRPALGFLSLGQVVPMVSFLPEAHRLRADLKLLSTSDDLAWVDVSAPGDGCSFALCDPVAVSGVAMPEKRWPLVLSAAFTQTLSPARWAQLRWKFFRLHFQYLCAFDRPGDYDYFRITAGPMTLAARFEGRAPSRSRLEVAVSKYRSVAA